MVRQKTDQVKDYMKNFFMYSDKNVLYNTDYYRNPHPLHKR